MYLFDVDADLLNERAFRPFVSNVPSSQKQHNVNILLALLRPNVKFG
jgi:4-hydroxybenzoate polyprenyltransferase